MVELVAVVRVERLVAERVMVAMAGELEGDTTVAAVELKAVLVAE